MITIYVDWYETFYSDILPSPSSTFVSDLIVCCGGATARLDNLMIVTFTWVWIDKGPYFYTALEPLLILYTGQ